MSWRLLKPFVILLILSLGIIGLGLSLGRRDGLLLAIAFALSIIALVWAYGDLRLMPLLQAREVEGQDGWGLVHRMTELSERLRVPTPRLFIIPQPMPQSLAIGRSITAGKIFLSEGLLRHLNSEEVIAIIAFHLACIKNRSTRTFTLASALADGILTFARTIDRVIFWVVGRKPNEDYHLGTLLLAPAAAFVIRATVSQRDYFLADAEAARLTGNPKALALALWKMASYAETLPMEAPPATSHFYVVNPLTKRRWSRYFHAQPNVKDRITSLIGYYPI